MRYTRCPPDADLLGRVMGTALQHGSPGVHCVLSDQPERNGERHEIAGCSFQIHGLSLLA